MPRALRNPYLEKSTTPPVNSATRRRIAACPEPIEPASWAATTLRRSSGPLPSTPLRAGRDSWIGTEPERRLGRQLSLFFRWIILAEWTLFGVVSFLCHHFHADELTAPLTGLIISLHFAPLAHLFRLPAYYATVASYAADDN